jgi:multidrug transporter EmrE-like cation transporter
VAVRAGCGVTVSHDQVLKKLSGLPDLLAANLRILGNQTNIVNSGWLIFGMNSNTFVLLLGAILCSVVGQVLLKAGANSLGAVGFANLGQKLIAMTTQPLLWAGLSIYAVSALGYIIVLSRAKLSAAAPLVAITYIFTVVAGMLFFGEAVPMLRWAGISCIMAGVVLVLAA